MKNSQGLNNAASDAVLAEALSWVGTPYRHQGSTKGVACDCLGLIRGVWRAVYGTEPERSGAYAPDWAPHVGARVVFGLADQSPTACGSTDRSASPQLLAHVF